MGSIQESLAIFELTSLPDLTTLQRHYTRLLKLYHPDLNLERPHWAHDKTRKLIEAFSTLKELIRHREILEGENCTEKHNREFWNSWWEESPGVRNNGFGASPWFSCGEKSDSRESEWYEESHTRYEEELFEEEFSVVGGTEQEDRFQVQLLRTQEGRYALPLSRVVRILSYRDSLVKRVMGEYLCLYEGESYQVTTLEGSELLFRKAEYLLLYDTEESKRAYLLPAGLQFQGIETVSPGEIIQSHNRKEGDGFLQIQAHLYRIPATILREIRAPQSQVTSPL